MQCFNFKRYCENGQVLGFPDVKYSTLLGAARWLVFFEYVTAASQGHSYPWRRDVQTHRVPARDGGCRMALRLPCPLLSPLTPRRGADVGGGPHLPCPSAPRSPGGTMLQEGIPPWDRGTAGSGTKSRDRHPKYYSCLRSI